MAVPELFNSIEQSGLSEWIRTSESVFGFYFILLFHTFGLSLLVGSSVVVALRILGVAADLPLASLKWLFGVMWVGFAVMATTGIFLVIAYPTKAFTNPMFYFKMTLVGLGLITMRKIKARVFDDTGSSETTLMANGKGLAVWSCVFWAGAMTAGRLLAYTATYLTYGDRL